MRHIPVATTVAPEHDHVSALERLRGPVTVIRRCESLAELVSVARAGLAEAVLVCGATDQLTLSFLESLAGGSPRPVAVVALADVPAERTRLSALRIPVIRPDRPAAELADLVIQAVEQTRATGSPQWHAGGDGEPEESAQIGSLTRRVVDGTEEHLGPEGEAASAPPAAPSRGDDDPPRADGAAQTGRERRGAESIALIDEEPHEPASATPVSDPRPVVDDETAAEDTRAPGPDLTSSPAARRSWRRLLGRGTGPSRGEALRRRGGAADAEQREGGDPRITAVWGPAGSPGRTTVAVNLAVETALDGRSTLLVDLDTYAASVAVHLGMLEETAGIARACHAADQGTLSSDALRRIAATARVAGGSIDVLTGLTRAERWPELRRQALDRVLETARQTWDEIVVDVGFCLEEDEELSFDVPAPQRNAATLSGLAAADRILAVGAGDAVGLPRLIRGLDELESVATTGHIDVVVNQTRADSSGVSPQAQVQAVWDRYGPERSISGFLPWDRKALDRALLSGQVLAEAAPNSPLRRALARWTARR